MVVATLMLKKVFFKQDCQNIIVSGVMGLRVGMSTVYVKRMVVIQQVF